MKNLPASISNIRFQPAIKYYITCSITTPNFFKSQYSGRLYVLLFLLAATGPDCKKDKTPDIEKIYFTGISPTDQTGNIMALPNSTDWNTADVWMDEEKVLFENKYATNCTPPSNYTIMAYPNPCRNEFRLALRMNTSTRKELRLVDENLKVLYANDSITATMIAIRTATFGIKDTVQLYYKFIENNCEFKGHGDILIQ